MSLLSSENSLWKPEVTCAANLGSSSPAGLEPLNEFLLQRLLGLPLDAPHAQSLKQRESTFSVLEETGGLQMQLAAGPVSSEASLLGL